MSILKYFQTSLPNPEQTGIGERATTYFKKITEVSKQLKLTGGKKRKAYSLFRRGSSEDMRQRMETAVRWKKSIKLHK